MLPRCVRALATSRTASAYAVYTIPHQQCYIPSYSQFVRRFSSESPASADLHTLAAQLRASLPIVRASISSAPDTVHIDRSVADFSSLLTACTKELRAASDESVPVLLQSVLPTCNSLLQHIVSVEPAANTSALFAALEPVLVPLMCLLTQCLERVQSFFVSKAGDAFVKTLSAADSAVVLHSVSLLASFADSQRTSGILQKRCSLNSRTLGTPVPSWSADAISAWAAHESTVKDFTVWQTLRPMLVPLLQRALVIINQVIDASKQKPQVPDSVPPLDSLITLIVLCSHIHIEANAYGAQHFPETLLNKLYNFGPCIIHLLTMFSNAGSCTQFGGSDSQNIYDLCTPQQILELVHLVPRLRLERSGDSFDGRVQRLPTITTCVPATRALQRKQWSNADGQVMSTDELVLYLQIWEGSSLRSSDLAVLTAPAYRELLRRSSFTPTQAAQILVVMHNTCMVSVALASNCLRTLVDSETRRAGNPLDPSCADALSPVFLMNVVAAVADMNMLGNRFCSTTDTYDAMQLECVQMFYRLLMLSLDRTKSFILEAPQVTADSEPAEPAAPAEPIAIADLSDIEFKGLQRSEQRAKFREIMRALKNVLSSIDFAERYVDVMIAAPLDAPKAVQQPSLSFGGLFSMAISRSSAAGSSSDAAVDPSNEAALIPALWSRLRIIFTAMVVHANNIAEMPIFSYLVAAALRRAIKLAPIAGSMSHSQSSASNDDASDAMLARRIADMRLMPHAPKESHSKVPDVYESHTQLDFFKAFDAQLNKLGLKQELKSFGIELRYEHRVLSMMIDGVLISTKDTKQRPTETSGALGVAIEVNGPAHYSFLVDSPPRAGAQQPWQWIDEVAMSSYALEKGASQDASVVAALGRGTQVPLWSLSARAHAKTARTAWRQRVLARYQWAEISVPYFEWSLAGHATPAQVAQQAALASKERYASSKVVEAMVEADKLRDKVVL